MGEQDYRGALRVFGWSFYSQGAAEGRQASADRFFEDALTFFGDPNPEAGDPTAKARRLAALIKAQKSLLLLDGLEPLQYPPGSEEGRLKEKGLCALLRDLAAQNSGLCLISSRLQVNDLQSYFRTSVRNEHLSSLSPKAGAQVLGSFGVHGSEKELHKTVKEFDGHALALNLLGTYLSNVYDGDIRKRDNIPRLVYEEERHGKHARWVMESYEQWFKETEKGSRELQILRIMGLFDRPARLDAIEALLKEPVIPGLTNALWEEFAPGEGGEKKEGWLKKLFKKSTEKTAQSLLQNRRFAEDLKFIIKDLQDLRLLARPESHENPDRHAMNDVANRTKPDESGSDAAGSSPFKGFGHTSRVIHGVAENSPPGRGQGWVLDCHPLIREHFAEKLKQEQPDAWKAAHSRLYDYYKALPEKKLPDKLEELEPLFAAVAHGSLAERHQEALIDVYWERIIRKEEFYTTRKLGAFGADLAALANFFEEVWSRPAAGLEDMWKAGVLSWAGFRLRGLGRLREAAQPMQAGMKLQAQREDWKNAASAAGNLSELWLSVGEIGRAVEAARQSVEFADRSGDGFQRYSKRTALADALHQSASPPKTHPPAFKKRGGGKPASLSRRRGLGDEFEEAEALFREAEEMQKEEQPDYPYLYSLQGFHYCDLLLSLGRVQEVRQRAAQTLEWVKQQNWLLDIALDRLSLGRAALLQAVQEREAADSENPAEHPALREAESWLEQAVAGLRDAGRQDYLPRSLLARAALRRVCRDFEKAWIDLNELYEIASRSGMRLFLADYHLEAARVLNAEGRIAEMREHLAAAASLIEETGYHRRDGELGELRALIERG